MILRRSFLIGAAALMVSATSAARAALPRARNAIEALINDAVARGDTKVIVPPGRYEVDRTIVIPSGVQFIMKRCHIVPAVGFDGPSLYLRRGHKSHIERCAFGRFSNEDADRFIATGRLNYQKESWEAWPAMPAPRL